MTIPFEPKRVSALNSFTKCAGLVASRAIEESEGGQAADTGTGVGRGAELWHSGKVLKDVLSTLKAEAAEGFPRADLPEVLDTVTRYCADPRNRPDVVVPGSCEQEVTITLPPDEDDPTGEPIVLVGHIDQLRYEFPDHPRRDELGMKLWDVKNGRASGDDMTRDYAFQLAAYTLGLQDLYPDVTLGGVIRTKGYRSREKHPVGSEPVFYHMPWTVEQCHLILGPVRYLIGQLRAGAVPATPGSWCRYCPLNFPDCVDGGLERRLSSPGL